MDWTASKAAKTLDGQEPGDFLVHQASDSSAYATLTFVAKDGVIVSRDILYDSAVAKFHLSRSTATFDTIYDLVNESAGKPPRTPTSAAAAKTAAVSPREPVVAQSVPLPVEDDAGMAMGNSHHLATTL
jgi:hypothetical protein